MSSCCRRPRRVVFSAPARDNEEPMAGTIHQAIVREVSAWPGVTIGRHRFGGTEFRHGRRELGHVHGSRLADLPFPLLIRDELVAAGRAEPHHIHPESGWVSYFIRGDADVAPAIQPSRSNFERPWTQPAHIARAGLKV